MSPCVLGGDAPKKWQGECSSRYRDGAWVGWCVLPRLVRWLGNLLFKLLSSYLGLVPGVVLRWCSVVFVGVMIGISCVSLMILVNVVVVVFVMIMVVSIQLHCHCFYN